MFFNHLPPIFPTENHRITSHQGDIVQGTRHVGIDIGAKKQGIAGDSIYSSQGGVVTVSGHPEWSKTGSSYIVVKGDDGITYSYVHTAKQYVNVGERVQQGQIIGTMGDDNTPGQVHLHIEMSNKKGQLDPERTLRKWLDASH